MNYELDHNRAGDVPSLTKQREQQHIDAIREADQRTKKGIRGKSRLEKSIAKIAKRRAMKKTKKKAVVLDSPEHRQKLLIDAAKHSANRIANNFMADVIAITQGLRLGEKIELKEGSLGNIQRAYEMLVSELGGKMKISIGDKRKRVIDRTPENVAMLAAVHHFESKGRMTAGEIAEYVSRHDVKVTEQMAADFLKMMFEPQSLEESQQMIDELTQPKGAA